MTKKEWLSLSLPETPLVSGKQYRGGQVTWSNGVTAYFPVVYKF